jgi:hypothetical protein
MQPGGGGAPCQASKRLKEAEPAPSRVAERRVLPACIRSLRLSAASAACSSASTSPALHPPPPPASPPPAASSSAASLSTSSRAAKQAFHRTWTEREGRD